MGLKADLRVPAGAVTPAIGAAGKMVDTVDNCQQQRHRNVLKIRAEPTL